VADGALEQAEEMGISLRDAATRVFSNAAGSYSANVGLAIENGGWEDESQLQEQFLSRKGFAFNADKPGILDQQADLFQSSLKRVDVTFQNLDSSEISLSDVSHYFDSDPTKVVQGLRTDGKKPTAFVADTTTANAQVRTLSETVRLDAQGDLFINQMNLLDRAVKLVAELDEPLDQNFVRANALQQSEELGLSLRDAATRVFSNAAGSYSANVGLAIENGGWEDESQLQEQFLSRKGFAFNADKPGVLDQANDVFKSSLQKVDVTFQNLDSSEISLSDVSHYFDSDPTKVVAGLRTDGKKPQAFVADTTTANAQVRTLESTVRLDARTKLLNPKFYEGMLKSGYEGTREITKRLRNTMGWSATAGAVDNFVYEDANEVFIADPEMQKRLLETNPNAFRDMVTTFLEANGRGYWDTTEENLDRLRQLYAEVDDKIEGM